jgi:hypothetical protein
MSIESWLDSFKETIDGSGFRHAAAAAVAEFMRRYGLPVGSFVEGRRRDHQELVILDLQTGAPQRPFYPVRHHERVGVLFTQAEARPLVTMLREDFPDTEHQMLVPEGWPATICTDDRLWAEARLTWTPAELIERILSWFRRAGRGELQDARQPLDPIFIGSHLSFYIARSVLDGGSEQNLVARHDPADRTILRVSVATRGIPTGSWEPLSIVGYKVPAAAMKRLRYAPGNLASVATMLGERGIDLFDDLTALLGVWLAEGPSAAWRINGRFVVIVEMPIVSPRGEQRDGLDHRAFITAQSAGDIAVALGLAARASGDLSKVGYVKLIRASGPDQAALVAIQTQVAEVHLEFESDFAARLAGRNEPDLRKAVLVGAGAIGSHVADYLAREGRFLWTIVDDDHLLPHNLARHTALNTQVAQLKANIVADRINATLMGPPHAAAIAANLFAAEPDGAAIGNALREADLIIDASASIVAARHLSDLAVAGRRASVFFNPIGTAAALLAEPAGRTLTLRDLEAQYYGLLLRKPGLSEHLGREAEMIAYTGACRAITNRIPQSRAAILSGLAALGLSAVVDGAAGAISVWTLAADGSVATETVAPEPVIRFRSEAWEIAMDTGLLSRIQQMREARVQAETGGVLFGLVDIPAKRIHLVDASPAPPDSIERRDEFIRGMSGVDDLIESVRRRTAGQVRYVGEWHSHPPRASARPSAIDGQQIDWLATLMGLDSMPALMLIAAEHETSIVFANQSAEQLQREQAT